MTLTSGSGLELRRWSKIQRCKDTHRIRIGIIGGWGGNVIRHSRVVFGIAHYQYFLRWFVDPCLTRGTLVEARLLGALQFHLTLEKHNFKYRFQKQIGRMSAIRVNYTAYFQRQRYLRTIPMHFELTTGINVCLRNKAINF